MAPPRIEGGILSGDLNVKTMKISMEVHSSIRPSVRNGEGMGDGKIP
jgi:hypothetical protein